MQRGIHVTPRELAEDWEPWAVSGLRAWIAGYDRVAAKAREG